MQNESVNTEAFIYTFPAVHLLGYGPVYLRHFDLVEYDGSGCSLRGFQAECGDGIHSHHIVSKRQVQGAKRCREYVEENQHIFRAWVCDVHNSELKLADLPEARAILFQAKIARYTYPVVEAHLEELRSRSKLARHEWRLEVIMASIKTKIPEHKALFAVHIDYLPALHSTRIVTAKTHPSHGEIPPLVVTDEAISSYQMSGAKEAPLGFLWQQHVWNHFGDPVDREYLLKTSPSGLIFSLGMKVERVETPRASLVELEG